MSGCDIQFSASMFSVLCTSLLIIKAKLLPLSKFRHSGTAVAGLMGLTSYIYWNMQQAPKRKVGSIDLMLERGSRPNFSKENLVVDRSSEIELIVNNFIRPKPESKLFGVILGPTGTGKTYLTQSVCNRDSREGVLYYHIQEDIYPTGMAKAIGMRLEPNGLFDVLMSYFGIHFTQYYKLDNNDHKAVQQVLALLGERSETFREKHGFMPTFFIDGIDLVAKSDKNVFRKIVNEAKRLANAGSLRIVLVSSEGTIMPLLHNNSSYSRAKTIEILDIDKEKTVQYMVDYEMPEMLAINVFALVGGRLTMLVSCLDTFRQHRNDTEDDLYAKIEHRILSHFGQKPNQGLVSADVEMKKIICEEVLNRGVIDPKILEQMQDADDKKCRMKSTVKTLVDHNVFRYDVDGCITWHSQLSKKLVEDYQRNGYKI